MLQALLADDEALSRAGLKAMIPWSEYGLSIAYEAANATEALAILQKHAAEVDVVLADVVMPVCNGIDLLQKIRELYQDLPVVMITYHNEFSYVRDALRLGALDYISKNELDSVHSMFQRILPTIRSYHERKNAAAPELCRYRYALCVKNCVQRLVFPESMLAQHIETSQDSHIYLLPDVASKETLFNLEEQLPPEGYILLISDIWGHTISEIQVRAHLFQQNEYFYVRLPNLRNYDVTLQSPTLPAVSSEALAALRERFESMMWIGNAEILEDLLAEMQSYYLPIPLVMDILLNLRNRCNQIYAGQGMQNEDASVWSFTYWYQWVDWVQMLRQRVYSFSGYSNYVPEIVHAIHNYLLYMSEHFADDLNAVDAASACNLSVSHFSKCFHKITGKTFVQYLRTLRLNNACKLLQQTKLPIARIAELCGIPDPLYFSRLFRKQFAVPPSSFRQH